ncbi:MAG: hypothetical protein JO159_16495 [Acidobacteria bacterium]|nr:hypothetical protein [Acidobacteriota bacterium]
MTRTAHEEARELITLAGTEDLPGARQSWLNAHLEECEACRVYAGAADRVVRALRSLPVACDSRLVRATQMRVRFHADRLRETKERMWLLAVACAGVGFSAAVSTPLLWRLFAWMSEWMGISSPVWQAGFIFFWVAPALVLSLWLSARHAHLPDKNNRSTQR